MSELTLDAHVLNRWIGRKETVRDTLSVATARQLQAALDIEPDLAEGVALPPLWHWCWFHQPVQRSGLGPDGHPERGGFLPPVALPRRMWAGGRLTFEAPMHVGERLTRVSTISDVIPKKGKSGKLCFVTVRHVFADDAGNTRMTEEQDIVYRQDPDRKRAQPDSFPPAAPKGATLSRTITPDTVLLFRYSALTFNSHRIHYDLDYCRDVEGYPGLLFHGPLTATLLAGIASEAAPGKRMKSFSFRAISPLFHTEPFTIASCEGEDGFEAWAENSYGGLAMNAAAQFFD